MPGLESAVNKDRNVIQACPRLLSVCLGLLCLVLLSYLDVCIYNVIYITS